MEQRCINRNIVECKANCFKCPSLRRPIVLIETLECKEHNNQTGKLFLHVLIETLWNVKQKDGAYFKATDRY